VFSAIGFIENSKNTIKIIDLVLTIWQSRDIFNKESMTTSITIRRATKPKLDAIAQHDRRKLIEVVDIAVDEYMDRHGIALTDPSVEVNPGESVAGTNTNANGANQACQTEPDR
jgi:hypothetical protein